MPDPLYMLDFPTGKQLQDFKRRREGNFTSFFRAKRCPVCTLEIPKEFSACSRACFDILAAKDIRMLTVTWTIDLNPLLTGEHRIETHEGAVRSGPITRINYHDTILPGKVVKIPESIEISGDAGDWISWATIKEIKRI